MGLIKRWDNLENFRLAGHIESLRWIETLWLSYLIGLCKRTVGIRIGGIVRRYIVLRSTKKRKLLRAMISQVLNGHIKEDSESILLMIL